MSVQADRGRESTHPTNRNKALKGSEWSAPLFGRFAPGEDSELITLGAGWVSETVWTGRKISSPTGIRSRTVQPVVRRYTDYAILTARSITTCQN